MKIKMMATAVAFLFCAISAEAQMHSFAIAGSTTGLFITGGQLGTYTNTWTNTLGKTIYVWGVQGDIWSDAFPVQTTAYDTLYGAGASYIQQLQSMADMGLYVYNSAGDVMLEKGSDHYAAAPELNAHGPVWFPVPFVITPGEVITLRGTAVDGYQLEVGGQQGWNVAAYIYYTTVAPTNIPQGQ